MDLSVYIVLDKDGEILSHFEHFGDAFTEFTDNAKADAVAHADCRILNQEIQFTSGKRGT